jgi:hypothetical protein
MTIGSRSGSRSSMQFSSDGPTPVAGVKPGPCRPGSFTASVQAGTAEELARVLGAHLEGESVGARSFEEREGPLRTLNDSDLWDALHDRMATLNAVAAAGDQVPADANVGWTGRTMKVPWFAEQHARRTRAARLGRHRGRRCRPDPAGAAVDDDPHRHCGRASGCSPEEFSNYVGASVSRRACGLPEPTMCWSMLTPTTPPSR